MSDFSERKKDWTRRLFQSNLHFNRSFVIYTLAFLDKYFEIFRRLTKVESKFFNLDSLSNTRLTPLHLVSLIVTLWGILPKDIRWQSSTKLESKGTKILVKTFKTFSSNSFFPTLSGMLEISKHTLREYSLFLLYFRS